MERILKEIRSNNFIVLSDDLSTNFSSYLVKAGENTKDSDINFMLNHGRGVILCSLPEDLAKERDLLPVSRNQSKNFNGGNFIFGPSIEARLGVHSGISSQDRAKTVSTLSNKNFKTKDLVSPGHIFPIISKNGGLLVNFGVSEAVTDILSYTELNQDGTNQVGVLTHLLNKSGELLNSDETKIFSETHKLAHINISDILKYLINNRSIIKEEAETILPTKDFGTFNVKAFRSIHNNGEHLSLQKSNKIDKDTPTLVRMHSERILGDLLIRESTNSRGKLLNALKLISNSDKGALVYIRKEEENYELGDSKEINKIESLKELGIGAQILKSLGITKVNILSNSDKTFPNLSPFNIEIVERTHLNDK